MGILEVQKVEQKNLTNACKFIDYLQKINKSVNNDTALNNTLLFVKLFFQRELNPHSLMDNQRFYLVPWIEDILQCNVDVFYQNKKIFGELPEKHVNMFRDIFDEIKEDVRFEEDRKGIWKFMHGFMYSGTQYLAMKHDTLYNNFLVAQREFLDLCLDISKDDPNVVSKLNRIKFWTGSMDEELLLAKITANLLSHEADWPSKKFYFIDHAVFGKTFVDDDDIDLDVKKDIEETQGWLKCVWEIAKKNEEDLTDLAEQINSLMVFAKCYFVVDECNSTEWETAFKLRQDIITKDNLRKEQLNK